MMKYRAIPIVPFVLAKK